MSPDAGTDAVVAAVVVGPMDEGTAEADSGGGEAVLGPRPIVTNRMSAATTMTAATRARFPNAGLGWFIGAILAGALKTAVARARRFHRWPWSGRRNALAVVR
jgi:hypothetical protein